MSSDPDGTLFQILAIIAAGLLLILYAIAVAATVAFERAGEHKLRELYAGRGKKRQRALYHMEHAQRFLSTTALLRTMTTVIAAVLLCESLVPMTYPIFPLDGVWGRILRIAVVLAVMCCFWLFLGNLLPRKLAANTPEKSLVHTMGIIHFFAILLRPATAVFTALSNAIVRAMGKDPHMEDQPVTEEQILRMVDESEEDGEIAGMEADMIENIFDFNDTSVSEIMTHRIDVLAVEDTATVQEVVNLAVNHGYSRIPVYHGSIDTITGVVYVKDLLRFIGKPLSRNIRVSHVMRKPYLVPESKAINKLFAEMTERRIQFAVLIDEYGGTAGVVTMEDILESIVGSIQDEYDNEEEEIFRLSDTMFTVDGSTPVDEVADLLDRELPEGDYDTVAGLVVEKLGNLPDENEFPSVMVGPVEFHVLEFEDNRIEKVLVEIHPELEEKDEDE